MPTSTLFFVDSFDHYSSSQVDRKWTSHSGSFSIVSDGRTGNGADIGGGGPILTLRANQTELSAGTAYRIRPVGGFANPPLGFQNIVPGIGINFELAHVGDGRFWIRIECQETATSSWTPTGGNIQTGASIFGPPSTLSIHNNEWCYLELQGIVAFTPTDATHATLSFSGNAYLNGALLCSISQSGTVLQSTYAGGAQANFAQFYIFGPGGGGSATFDDVYLTDTELLGDIKIAVLYPNAAGDTTAWTPNASGANYTKVKEHPADDDTTYVSAGGAGVLDLYNLDDIGTFTGNIMGAQSLVLAKKSDSGYATIVSELKSAGTTQDGLPWNPSNGAYVYGRDAYRVSPFTSTGWILSEINALQLGQKRTA